MISMCGAAVLPASAVADSQCPAANPTFNGPCGPTFTLPNWGDAAGWKDPSQYTTIQLADVLGEGRDQLIARGAGGIEIWEFDTAVGQWRPALDADGNPMLLTAFADPPPLTEANPNPPDTDWTLPQHYTTIQTGDLLGTGRPQIIGRSAHGVIVLSYTPGPNGSAGTWSRADTGAFIDPVTPAPWWYQTIGTANLTGGPADELYGIDGNFDLKVVSWSDGEWKLLPGSGGNFPPGVQGNTLQPSPVIDGQQELWFETTQGITGRRLVAAKNEWVTSSNLPPAGSFSEPFWDRIPYFPTIRFADSTDLVGRGVDGLEGYRQTANGWQAIPTLTALSDANGFNQEQNWRTITHADLDGDGQADVLARGPQGMVAYELDQAADGWTQMPGSIDLEDDPWGSDQSYYGTFRAGDVDGDGADDLIARGPYGIRTWFYNRPGQPGFGPYLPSGYPAFTGTASGPQAANTGPAAAYDAVNVQAKATGVLTGNESSVRAVWSADATADTDLGTLTARLSGLPAELAGTLVGNCGTTPQRTNPLQYASCTPPSNSTGFTPGDWTAVVNELLSELYDAQQVLTFYTAVDTIRNSLFLGESFELPNIGSKIGLAGAANATASFDVGALMSEVVGVLGSLVGDEIPGVGSALSVSSYVISMIPSASPVSSDPFSGTYTQLQGEWATVVTQADAAAASLNFQVRSDRNLMRLVSQLSAPGAPWGTSGLDQVGMESAGNQGFTLWVYKALLPAVYARYEITNCRTSAGGNVPPFTDPNFPLQFEDCSAPMNLVPLAPSPSPWVVALTPAFAFRSVEPLPQGSFQSGSPCHEYLQGLLFECAFTGPDPGIVSTVSDPVSTKCIHQPENPNTTWSFGCSLGIDSSAILYPAPVLNSVKETWGLQSRTGSPLPLAAGLSGSATPAAATAGAARAGDGARGHVVRLAGTMPRTPRLGLRDATVAVDRVLTVPDTGDELVARRASTRLRAGGPRTRRLGSVRLRQTSRGRFRSQESGRKAPRISLKLTPRGRRSLAFDLTVANVAIPRLSDVCGHGLAPLRITPRPFALAYRMRVLPAPRGPLGISTTADFACRYARSGAVRGLRVVRPSRPAKLGRSLSLRLGSPRRLTAGRRGTLTATVRNPTSRKAQDVYIYTVLPRGLRVAASTPRARITGRRVAWRVAGLRGHRSRTFRLRVLPGRAGTSARCSSVHVRALLRRPARTTACVQVSPARPPRITG